ncbi:MAG: hypothetical protein Q7R87_00675 [Nanoarchaeota archaeon]|nr:hypothetical protein [Nanoarchaeota archaeon]
MGIIREFLTSMTAHPVFISFLAGIMGEDYVFLMAILSGSGFISLWSVIIFGIVGVFLHDVCLYFISKAYHGTIIKERLDKKSVRRGIDKWLLSWRKTSHYFIPLIISKFIFGARILTIFYIARREKSFKKFIFFDIIAGAIWFSIMMPIGWFVGKGFVQILHFGKDLEKIIVFLFLFWLVYYIINKTFKRTVVKKINSKQIKDEQ